MDYRFYFLGQNCRIVASREYEADSDAAAVEIAWSIYKLASVPHYGFELWQDKRLVHTEGC